MLIEIKTMLVKPGHADQVVERFSRPGGPITEIPGFIDLSVMVNRRKKDEEEVVVLIRWESEEAWKAWEKSPAHIEGHRKSRQAGKPDYMLGGSTQFYDVKTVKSPTLV
ncbi:antibiotic biosynthesis monooxygenase [Cohnella lubricantis]|uniref:Antibiotic biosynthesis monooxygenase n=1 Tax=Cohnella lubricantis TaxID=2163172 RepID=A0A841TLD5_9BACL|nr:antibiotic biosynthesis monooxygenase [Cohnella lubricantis]MBB6679737.1 antibiotic biosynthesis monooxygenase [Cohnella lubricantis]MBP2120277.1 heme oxygenase (staphylobilin-producing) [Cohnella lubricantis]